MIVRPCAIILRVLLSDSITPTHKIFHDQSPNFHGSAISLLKGLCVCLYSGSVVRLASRGEEEVTILGIDDYGYLRVRTNKTQELLSLQPDGNTFDIMKGLIAI